MYTLKSLIPFIGKNNKETQETNNWNLKLNKLPKKKSILSYKL